MPSCWVRSFGKTMDVKRLVKDIQSNQAGARQPEKGWEVVQNLILARQRKRATPATT